MNIAADNDHHEPISGCQIKQENQAAKQSRKNQAAKHNSKIPFLSTHISSLILYRIGLGARRLLLEIRARGRLDARLVSSFRRCCVEHLCML
jgi:hypothetical protein